MDTYELAAAIKISGIGLLPVFVVLACAAFLWGMIVRSSLTTRRDLVNAQLENVGKIALQRVRLLQQLGALLGTELLTDPEGYNETTLATETRRIEATIATLGFATHPEVHQLQVGLATNAAILLKAQHQFRAVRNSYNELCRQMPYRLVASLSGFKPFAI